MTKNTLKSLKANYQYLLGAPLVRDLLQNIKRLEKENLLLRKTILHLAETIPEKGSVDVDTFATPISGKKSETNIKYELIDIDVLNTAFCEDDEADSADQEEADSADQEETDSADQEEADSADQEEADSANQEEVEETDSANQEEVEETDSVNQEEADSANQEEVEETDSVNQEEADSANQEEVEEIEEETDSANQEETDSADQELEVFEITILGKKYFATDTQNGEIYAMLENEDVGDKVGQFVRGIAKMD
jgi:hypothetical protein